jgi:alanine dehydrogenase
VSCWISEAQVRRLLRLDALEAAMERALASYSTGRVTQPLRPVIEAADGILAAMPALNRDAGQMGAKLVSVYPGNSLRGLPSHQAVIVLFDSGTGEPLAAMDGRYITEMRTAAVSAVSLKWLGPETVKVLALVGTGVQARSHLEMLGRERSFDEIRCWSPRRESRERFAREHEGVRACQSVGEAVRGADAIVVATQAREPVVQAGWVKDGAHVMAVGACRPNDRELDPNLVAAAELYVDSRESALRESGDVILAMRDAWFGEDHISAELGEVIAGVKPGRSEKSRTTVFKSLGLACEDLAAAGLVWEARVV